jgi:hypothetical protein
MNHIRPKRIVFSAFDPLDDAELCSANLEYDPRLAAYGVYSKYHKQCVDAAKAGCGHILESREPLITIQFVR